MTVTAPPATAAASTEFGGRIRNGRLDPEVIRRDFPILATESHGHPLVFLDSASTSQKPTVVIDALDGYYRDYNANVHRGIYEIGERATASYEAARASVARFINAPDSHEVIFTRNATEAINLVAYSWGRRNIGRGDAIVLTEMEHHANLVPWQLLAQEKDGDLEFIPITDDGVLRQDVYEVLLRLKPKLVAFTHVSNTLGTINPVREMVEAAHAAGALVLIDGAQAVPHVPVDVQELGADFYAFSGHKMLAPTGSGALWARRELLEAMPPFMAGGDMIREVHLRRSEWNDIPWKFEAGTPDIAAGIGLGAASEYLSELGMDRVREHERELLTYALDALQREHPDVNLYGPMDADIRCGVIPFNVPGVHPHDVAQVLDRSGVAVRAGHHCTMPLHERLDLPATARASFNVYTTQADIDALIAGLAEVKRIFGVNPDTTEQLLAAAEAMGIEIDREEAARWIEAVSADSGGSVMVDVDTGVYGHRVSMADYDDTDIERFRRMGRIVGLEDRPPDVTTALALSGSAAQARVHRFPADADFFERVHIRAETRDAACLVLAGLLRDKALATMHGAGHRLQEVKFGNWPADGSVDGSPVRRGTPVSWTPAQVETGGIAYLGADGSEAVLWWDDAAIDPGWCKLDWVIAVPGAHGLANVSNMFDATWEAPDGTIIPLDGFLDTYFQEVYLETESIPLFSKLVKQMGADSVAEYVGQLRSEVYTYTVEHPNYGKAARRLYNIFRLTGQYAEAAFIRELFDEPVTALYQVAALLRTLGEADDAGDTFATEAMLLEFDGLIMSTINALEGRAEVEMVRRLLHLREEFSRRALEAVADADLASARADAMEAVDAYFKRVLEGVPSIKAYLEEIAAAHED